MESVRIHELHKKVQSKLTTDELESLSNQAINWIQREACAEPENRSKLGILNGPKKSISGHIYKIADQRYFDESVDAYFRRVGIGSVMLYASLEDYVYVVSKIFRRTLFELLFDCH